jgi:rSAM/selenodomain-associated transferase 1
MRLTTVGVMARAPVPGRCKTRLAATVGADLAARVTRSMLLDTLDRVAEVLPASRLVIMAAPEHGGVDVLSALAPAPWAVVAQEGDGLGARLGHAFTTLSGPDTTVSLVSADSPTAPWSCLRALDDLQPGHVAMGPCEDGGYWLIATAGLDVRILEGIHWSTERVAAQTRARCQELGLALTELDSAYDIDEAKDLERLHTELRAHPERAPRTAALLMEGR